MLLLYAHSTLLYIAIHHYVRIFIVNKSEHEYFNFILSMKRCFLHYQQCFKCLNQGVLLIAYVYATGYRVLLSAALEFNVPKFSQTRPP